MKYEKEIACLRHMIEQSLGQQVSSPADFQMLKDEIFKRIKISISLSTLKRIWEYVSAYTNPTTHTLSTLAQFIGFHNWDDFLDNYNDDVDSSHRLLHGRIFAAEKQKAAPKGVKQSRTLSSPLNMISRQNDVHLNFPQRQQTNLQFSS